MSWSLINKFEQSEQYVKLYNSVLTDVTAWYAAENKIRPLEDQIVNGVQKNALLNFITFDLHALIKTEGFVHMQKLLQGKETEQSVMIRLKDLVTSLYIKYGEDQIDKLRDRTYRSIDNMYGLTFKSKDMDVNNTFWLYPFFRHIYTVTVPLNIS
jgi:hypothetical protein